MTNFTGLNGRPVSVALGGSDLHLVRQLHLDPGGHTMKFGFAWERSGENDNDEINVSACRPARTTRTASSLFTDSRSGQPSIGRGGGQRCAGPVRHLFGARPARIHAVPRQHVRVVRPGFLEGEPKLTLTYGVRYTINFPYSALWRNMSVFDPASLHPQQSGDGRPEDGQYHSRLGRPVQRHGDPGQRLAVFSEWPGAGGGFRAVQPPVPQPAVVLLEHPVERYPAAGRNRLSTQRQDRACAPASAASSPAWA